MTYPILESYSWLTSDMTVNDAPGNKVIIRGPALFSFEKFFKKGVSRNKRRYIQSEVVRSARTLKNVPIDVNHEISLWEERGEIGSKPVHKGHVIFGEEENGTVEYTAEINHKEYVQKIRDTDKVRKGVMTEKQYFNKWLKAPIVGVSVDADFLKLTCSRCGERFEVFELYKHHMAHAHGLKDVSLQPFGITFKRLSLVEPPEQPGVLGADFEIVETAQAGMYRLYESITSNLKETDEMKKKKKSTKKVKETKTPSYLNIKEDLDPTTTVTIDEIPAVAATGETPVIEPPEAELVVEKPTPICPEGFHPNPDGEGCLPDAVEEKPLPPEGDLPPALDVSDIPLIPPITEQTPAPVAPIEPEVPTIPEEPTCEEGSHYDKELGTCVPDGADLGTEPKDPDMPITEIKLPAKLRLGEPFSSYTDFADCVSKNQDKEDPEAYCASIKQKTEGEPASEVKESTNIYETNKAIREAIKRLNTQSFKREVQNAEAINQLNEAVAKFTIQTRKFLKNLNDEILLESRLRGGYDSRVWKWMKELSTEAKTITANVNKVIASANKGFTQLGESNKKLVETANKKLKALNLSDSKLREYADKKLGQIATAQAKLKGDVDKFNTRMIEVNKNLKTDTAKINEHLASLSEKLGNQEEYGKALAELKEQYTAFVKAKEQEEEPHTCPDGEHWSKEENKCVPNESTIDEIKKLTEVMTTRMDNLESKVKPKFDGHNIKSESEEAELDAETPYQPK